MMRRMAVCRFFVVTVRTQLNAAHASSVQKLRLWYSGFFTEMCLFREEYSIEFHKIRQEITSEVEQVDHCKKLKFIRGNCKNYFYRLINNC